MKLIAENVNTVLVVAGFVALEVGIMRQWSGAVAAMVGGVLVMLIGSWPYLARTWQKRG